MRALVAFEAGVCKCGFHESLTNDRANHFTFEKRRCPVCAAADRYARIQGAADDEADRLAGEKAPPGSPKPGDGRTVLMRRMSPAEVEERRATAGPTSLQPRNGQKDSASRR